MSSLHQVLLTCGCYFPLAILILCHPQTQATHSSTRILFGSCSKPYLEQPLWPSILSRDPDIWIWTGDIVYHDRPDVDCLPALLGYLNPLNEAVTTFHCRRIGVGAIAPHEYQQNFALQLQHPAYSQLRHNQHTKILGIWDDHDYAQNDGNSANPYKHEAKQALLQFLDIPSDAAIRSRDGVYSFHTFTFGERNQAALIVDVYLLDIRWFSDPKHNILFGEQQWQWLEERMKQRASVSAHTEVISLFVSGVQILPFYRGYWSEAWSGKSAADRMRFVEAILNYNVSRPVLISGDVHWGEQMRYNCKRKNSRVSEAEYRSLYEITSSGLTHSWAYTYPSYWTWLKNIAHAWSADGATLGLTNDLNFGEIEVLYKESGIDALYLRVYGLNGVQLEVDLMQQQYQVLDERGKQVLDRHLEDVDANGNDWLCVGYNQPDVWLSRLYLLLVAVLLFVGLIPVWFVITGGCFAGCCCCCGCCCGKGARCSRCCCCLAWQTREKEKRS